jgi:pimeloyl-ACP methyl ester carboxylesterase
MFAADAEARLSELSEEQLRACAPEVTHADFAACNAFDVMARVGEIAAPTLVIVGRDDQMTPLKFSEFLASKIRDARLIVVERAGHSVMLEQPEVVNEAVRAFVKKS